jgi:hypothetical protein
MWRAGADDGWQLSVGAQTADQQGWVEARRGISSGRPAGDGRGGGSARPAGPAGVQRRPTGEARRRRPPTCRGAAGGSSAQPAGADGERASSLGGRPPTRCDAREEEGRCSRGTLVIYPQVLFNLNRI